MRKSEELTNPKSCMSKAKDNEMTFVLLGRDAAAPLAIRAWAEARILIGKNKRSDPQITEALRCADQMELEFANEVIVNAGWQCANERTPIKDLIDLVRVNSIDECCHAALDGECIWDGCPQNRDGEPEKTGRTCPLKWLVDGRE